MVMMNVLFVDGWRVILLRVRLNVERSFCVYWFSFCVRLCCLFFLFVLGFF